MSDSVRPHRWQPTRLHHPWDSPGKNTGVGCHFLLQGRKVKSKSEVVQSCLTPSDPIDCSLPGPTSLSAIRVVSSAYRRLLIFLLAVLIPACASSSPAFCMMYSAAAAESLQSCPTLCDPMDCSLPGSSILHIS